jgi:hypothetical protein
MKSEAALTETNYSPHRVDVISSEDAIEYHDSIFKIAHRFAALIIDKVKLAQTVQ